MPFQRLLFNHIGDGALPRSDPNLSAPEKGGYVASVFVSHGMCNSVLSLFPPVALVSLWKADVQTFNDQD